MTEHVYDLQCYKCTGTGLELVPDGPDDLMPVECDCWLPLDERHSEEDGYPYDLY